MSLRESLEERDLGGKRDDVEVEEERNLEKVREAAIANCEGGREDLSE